MTIDIPAFQAFLYTQIPLVKSTQLQLQDISETELIATAPIAPNINDKQTVFGGSSSALMTICGWSLIKTNLEKLRVHNDVVIYQSKNHWLKAQKDDLIIKASIKPTIDWEDMTNKLINKNRSHKLDIYCQVLNQQNEVCSDMVGQYVILKNSH